MALFSGKIIRSYPPRRDPLLASRRSRDTSQIVCASHEKRYRLHEIIEVTMRETIIERGDSLYTLLLHTIICGVGVVWCSVYMYYM